MTPEGAAVNTQKMTAPNDDKFPAPTYQQHYLSGLFEDTKRLFLDNLLDIHRAHGVMLAERGIIPREDAAKVLAAVNALDPGQIRQHKYDGTGEDLFFFVEKLLAEKCGADVAGRLHTARSRNDIDATLYRLRLRVELLGMIGDALGLREALLDLAARHLDSLMPAYTHAQPAQPTTVAHYLLAMAEVLGRDIVRLQRAFANANSSPMGSCAITTTGFNISRERVAELLGFDSVAENSYAAIASIDYATETAGSLSVLLVNVTRWAQDLLLMSMREFGFLQLAEGYLQTSSIMPQKRNPVALEHVRALASRALGRAQAVFTAAHNTPFGDINDTGDDLQPIVFDAMDDARRAVALFAGMMRTARFDTRLLAERAGADYLTVTELADTLVREEGLSFKTAHSIVAMTLQQASGSAIGYDALQSVAKEALGRALSLTRPRFEKAIEPTNFVSVRKCIGGPAPQETERQLRRQQEEHRRNIEWMDLRTASLEKSRSVLQKSVQSYVGAL